MKIPLAGFLVLMTACLSPQVSAQEPKRDILGIHLAMATEDAKKRLSEIGTFARGDRKQQEIWTVRDASYSHVIIGSDKEGRLRFITAVARTDDDAKRVPYSEVIDITQARQAGDPAINNFNYEWRWSASSEQPETLAIARGRDPEFLSTYSLKRLTAPEPEDAEESPRD